MTSRYIKFARQYERTHARLREELAGTTTRLAAGSVSAPHAEDRIDDARPSFALHPPIDPTAANNPWWVRYD